jgi:integrase
MALTLKEVAKLTEIGRHFDEDGLYLQVRSADARSWILRYMLDGRERWLGLGSARTFNLLEARQRARKARQLLADGIDPLDQKRALKQQNRADAARRDAALITFETAALRYFDQHNQKWKNEVHRKQFTSSMKQYVYPKIGKLTVGDIDKDAVLRVLDPIWKDKTETANRVRGRIETVLNFAAARGWRQGDNPARWRGFLDQLLMAKSHLKEVKHHRTLPFADLPVFMAALRARDGVSPKAIEFTILTAARTSEVTGARWDEIDFEQKTWTVPKQRMKANREHRVPLTDAMIAALNKLPRENGNPFVFVGPRKGGLSNMAMDAVLRRMGYKDRATIHGFRSTFRDWASEISSFPGDVAEAALAHITGDKVELSYKRGDLLLKRRKLMEAWSGFCAKTPTEANNVRNLHTTAVPLKEKICSSSTKFKSNLPMKSVS